MLGGLQFRQVSTNETHTCGVSQVSTGGWHSCGKTLEGVAYCWGWNGFGQLGDGTTSTRTKPVAVAGAM